jgi:hypothetical protein
MKKIMTTALLCGAAMANAATGAGAGPQGANNSVVGAVFAATNDVKTNEVVMYTRTGAGALKYVGNFATGGRGEGGINDPLQAESSITLTADHKFLIVVNAGSSSVSVFAVYPNTLSLVDTKAAIRSASPCMTIWCTSPMWAAPITQPAFICSPGVNWSLSRIPNSR